MTDPNAPQDEMAELRFRPRPGSEPEEPLLDMILDGHPLPPSAPQGLHTLAAGLADLTRGEAPRTPFGLGAPAGPGRLIGEPAALAAFRQAVGRRATSPAMAPRLARGEAPLTPLDRRRRRPLAAFVRVRLATLAAAAAITVGGTAAAYAGALPTALQDFAHKIIGAPSGGNGHDSQLPGHPQPTVSPGANSAPGGAVGHGTQRGQGSATNPAGRGRPTQPAHSVAPTPHGTSHRPATPRPSGRPSPSATPGGH